MSSRTRTRPMTLRVYHVHPDGTTTEVRALHVAAVSVLRGYEEPRILVAPDPTTPSDTRPV